MATTYILHFPGDAPYHVEEALTDVTEIRIRLVTTAPTATCPECRGESDRIHSRYERTLGDLAVQGVALTLRIRVRRFRCRRRDCRRRIFTEHLGDLAARSARRTNRLQELLRELGFVLGGEAGARLAGRLAAQTSPATLLRLVRATPDPEAGTPRILGVDDWALRKGRVSGTLLDDHQARRPIDLLPDRSAESLANWLKEHLGVEIITRDRAGAYAEGAATGAPEAIQVADRWHLLKNLGDAVERFLDRHRSLLRAVSLTSPDLTTKEAVSPAVAEPTATTLDEEASVPRRERERQQRRANRRVRYEEVLSLPERGLSDRQIARSLGLSRATVKRYLSVEAFPEIAARPSQPSILDPDRSYLEERWQAGCHNGQQLWDEWQERGFPGSRSLVAAEVTRLRRAADPTSSQSRTGAAHTSPTLSPRQAKWLLLRPLDRLSEADQAKRECLLTASDEMRRLTDVAQEFQQIVREQRREALDAWLTTAASCGIPELRGFAAGIQRDYAAVAAALTHSWSNGPVEGEITQIKLIKRQMYGRASFDLLRKRVLAA